MCNVTRKTHRPVVPAGRSIAHLDAVPCGLHRERIVPLQHLDFYRLVKSIDPCYTTEALVKELKPLLSNLSKTILAYFATTFKCSNWQKLERIQHCNCSLLMLTSSQPSKQFHWVARWSKMACLARIRKPKVWLGEWPAKRCSYSSCSVWIEERKDYTSFTVWDKVFIAEDERPGNNTIVSSRWPLWIALPGHSLTSFSIWPSLNPLPPGIYYFCSYTVPPSPFAVHLSVIPYGSPLNYMQRWKQQPLCNSLVPCFPEVEFA